MNMDTDRLQRADKLAMQGENGRYEVFDAMSALSFMLSQ